MGILQAKLSEYNAPQQAMEAGIYPYFRVIQSDQDTEVLIDGKKVLMFGSNSYLGLTNHPKIKEYTKKDSAVVLAFQNKNNTLTLISFIENIDNTVNDLKTHLMATLPPYMIPRKFYSVTAMPLNNSGKIDRKKLMEMHTEE